MNLNIDFDELMHAFESSNVANHFYIDIENNEIININKYVDDDIEEKLEEMNNPRFIIIPEKFPSDDFRIIELFIYEIVEEDNNLADDFYQVLDKPKPFRRFRELLDKYPELKEKWFKYKDNQLKNELINWLLEKNIILEGQKLIPEIEIKELAENEFNILPDEWKDFRPSSCMNCENNKEIKARIFLLNMDIENSLIDNEVKKIMEEKYNIKKYGVLSTGKEILLTASKCPICGCEEVFWDF
jgi:hypothetical protein